MGGEDGLHDYSPLGERVGFLVTSCWGSWFNGYFPLGKLVSGLLPAGERVGCMITPHWGEGGFYIYFPLGKLVLWLLPAGEVGFRVTPHEGRGWVA